mgnify:CR=1 FL=1
MLFRSTEHDFRNAKDALAFPFASLFRAGVAAVEGLGKIARELEMLRLVVSDGNVSGPKEVRESPL